MSDVDREIGRHDADIENLKTEMKAVREDLDDIKKILEQTRGGWKVLLAVAATAGTVGAALSKLIGFKVGV